MVDNAHTNQLLKKYFRVFGPITHRPDGLVDVAGSVTLTKKPTKGILPVHFGAVTGEFHAESKDLISLRNMPKSCTRLLVSGNKLTDLEHAPDKLILLQIDFNNIAHLKHCPQVEDAIFAFGNPFMSLEGLPAHVKRVYLTYHSYLPVLRLVNVTQRIHIGTPGPGYARLQPFEPVNSIINKYLGQGKPGALKAAAELIRAGYKDNARW